MAVNMKLGIDVGAFKKGIADANAQLKTFDAQLKLAETSMKSAGNAEQGLVTKTNALEGKLKTQKSMIQQYTRALDDMKKNGVDPLSREYQQLQAAMLNTKTAMMETEQALNGLDSSQQQAATSATQLVNSVNSIGKKISLDQVINGINGITKGLESAAKKAVDLGEMIWSAIMDSARWSDDTATMATIMDMSTEDYQRYQKVFDTIGDITVSEWHKMKRKVEKAIQDPTEDQNQLFSLLGISTHEMHAGKYGPVAGMAKTYEDLFWEVSRELQRRVESGKMSQASANVYAEALFGKGFDELKPLIALGEEGFKAALKEQEVASEESIQNLAELNDKVIKLKSDFQTLQVEVLGKIAPALTRGAEVLDKLLGKLMDYLKSPEGQQALENMGQAVEGLFTDLSKIDPEMVVEGFAKVFGDIVKGMTWLADHWSDVENALKMIAGGFALLKVSQLALDIGKIVSGFKTLWAGADNKLPTIPGTEQTGTGTGTGTGTTGGPSWVTTFLNNAVNGMGVKAMYDLNNYVANLFRSAMEGKTTEEKQEYALMHDFGITQEELFSGPGVSQGRKFNIEMDLPEETKRLFEQTIDLTKNQPAAYNPMDEIKGMTLEEKQAYALMHDFGIKPIEENEHFVVEDVDIEALLNAKDGKEQIEEQVGTVSIPVTFVPAGGGGGGGTPMFVYDHWNGMMNRLGTRGFANGLWSVPYDGFLARLHKNERIVPAREVGSSRNFSSNLYVESMYMNNGTDAAGLASAMAAAQQRTMNGFGS